MMNANLGGFFGICSEPLTIRFATARQVARSWPLLPPHLTAQSSGVPMARKYSNTSSGVPSTVMGTMSRQFHSCSMVVPAAGIMVRAVV